MLLFLFMKTPIVFLLALCAQYASAQEADANKILQRAAAYYSNQQVFTIQVENKTRTSIAVDTTRSTTYFFVDRKAGQQVFMAKTNGMLIDGDTQYDIDFSRKQFTVVKKRDKKTYIFDGVYRNYIFNNATGFVAQVGKEPLQLRQTDSSYVLWNLQVAYEFRKDDGSLRRITRLRYDSQTKGISFSELVFSNCITDTMLVKEQIDYAMNIVTNGNNTADKVSPERPKAFDVSMFGNNALFSCNADADSLKGEYVLLDFFFQGCYPCVLSYPSVEELFEDRGMKLSVIGIDSRVDDSSSLKVYAERYKIRYPLIAGVAAKRISEILAVGVWPTFVLLDSKGNVLEYSEGLSEAFFKKVRRKYLEGR